MDPLSGMMEANWLTLAVGLCVLAASVILVASTKSSTQTGAKENTTEATKEKEQLPDQCGLYNDGIAWVRKKADPGIRESDATPEQRTKYLAILRTIFAPASLLGQRVDFDPNDVVKVAFHAMKYFESEPALIEDVQPPLTVVADLHGQLYDLNRIFVFHEKDGQPGYECAQFLFLGNYVDRGRQSLEVVMALFILKILYPAKFFLLRGSHEFTGMNLTLGFGAECVARFSMESAKIVYAVLNAAFSWLSMCSIIGGKVFVAHSGISTTGFNLRGLRNMRKPMYDTFEGYLEHDLIWADPAEGLTGTCHNVSRQSSIYFGEDVFALAMHKIGCSYMIRGHTIIKEGAECTWDRIYTLYSCTDQYKNGNLGSFGQVAADLSLQVFCFSVDENRKKMKKAIFGDEDVDEDNEKEAIGIARM